MVRAGGRRPRTPASGLERFRRAAMTVAAAATGLGAALWFPTGEPAGAQAPGIAITDFAFTPNAFTAQMVPPEPTFLQPHAHAGFFNNGQTKHNVTFGSAAATSSPDLDPGAFFDAVFTAAGTFPYRCTIHPSMTGTITVLPMPTPTTQATEPPTTVAPSTIAPTTQAAPTTTTRPSVTTTTRARVTTTAAPTTVATTVAPPVGEPTTAPTTVATTTTTTTTGGVALPTRNTSSDSPRWSVIVLVVVLAAGAAAFAARTVLQRRRPPGAPPAADT